MNIQFKKGVLELCVLSILKHKNCYGYELVNDISQNITISEGTIYPLLRRMKNEGYVETYLQESQEGPPRKYYALTAQGEEARKNLDEEWYSFIEKVNNIVKGGAAVE
ncbi:transcriptional regulator, padr family [hydrocarbon metagenome]|uniref:Transcriptional regulator, padr family n=1 Tax=hydrocarbon metagenome TaxID=938273 RepID=A0A0W8E6L9_9ZZZZ